MYEKTFLLEIYDPEICGILREQDDFSLMHFTVQCIKKEPDFFERCVKEGKLSEDWVAFKERVLSVFDEYARWRFRGIANYNDLNLKSLIDKGYDLGLERKTWDQYFGWQISPGRDYIFIADEGKAWEYLEFHGSKNNKGLFLVYDLRKLTIPPRPTGSGVHEIDWDRFVRMPAAGFTFSDALLFILVIHLKY